MLFTIVLLLFLTFSFSIFETLLKGNDKKYTIWIWGDCALILAFLIRAPYVFQRPSYLAADVGGFVCLLLVMAVAGRYAGFRPQSVYDRLTFLFAYPLFEELTFRGILLGNLSQYPLLTTGEELPLLGNASLAVLLAALVFAVHLQFYKACWRQPWPIFLSFLGGILFGVTAQATASFLPSFGLHLAFNAGAMLFRKKSCSC